jgi:hypothetical protein
MIRYIYKISNRMMEHMKRYNFQNTVNFYYYTILVKYHNLLGKTIRNRLSNRKNRKVCYKFIKYIFNVDFL